MNNKVINHFLTLLGITIFSGCLFEEVDQPAELAIGDTFTTVLNINSIAQEVNNAHHGIVGVLHPEGWVFESGWAFWGSLISVGFLKAVGYVKAARFAHF